MSRPTISLLEHLSHLISGGDLEVGRATLVDGRATVAIDTATLGVGKWQLTVVYDGDANHSPSTTTVVLKVNKL